MARTVKQYGFFFEPSPLANAAARQFRIDGYQIGTRILFNAITDPFNTYEEFRDMTIQEHIDRALDETWLFNNVVRSGYDTFMLTILLVVIYGVIGKVVEFKVYLKSNIFRESSPKISVTLSTISENR